MRCAIINDGYTFEGETDAIMDLFPSLKFKYRPCTHMERMEWVDAEGDLDTKSEKSKLQAEMIAKHIVSWNAKEREGKKFKNVDINAENALRLHSDCFNQLVLILIGWIARTAELRKVKPSETDSNSLEGMEKN